MYAVVYLTGDISGEWLVVDDNGVVLVYALKVHIVEAVECSS